MFFTTSVLVTRPNAAGSYDSSGVFVPPSTQTLTIQASVQPLNSREIMMLPEGDRAKERIKLFSDVPLFSQDEGPTPADTVQWSGKSYKVVATRDYTQGTPLPYYRAEAVVILAPEA